MEFTYILLIIATFTILLLLFFLLLPRIRKYHSDGPDHSLDISHQPHPFDFKGSPDDNINQKIIETVNSMGGSGDDADATYQVNLEHLKIDAGNAVPIIIEAYNRLADNLYLDRWSLIQLLVDLKHPSSIMSLDEVISTPIPHEQSDDPHSFTTVGEEVIIRTTAIEGLSQLAAEGNSEVLDTILKHTRHENFSVKRASIQAYLVHGGEKARGVLLGKLSDCDHFILDIQQADVQKIPQPHAEKTLKHTEIEDLPRVKSPKPTHVI